MIRFRRLRAALRLAAVGATGALLASCALLSSPDPVQLYRFGGAALGGPAEVSAAPPVAVGLRRIDFTQAARGDRILSVTGVEAAYVAGARWVAPAETLYVESLEAAFEAQSPRVRLLSGRGLAPVTRSLEADVRVFEARYPAPGAAPTIVVSTHVRLLALPERRVAAERLFTVSQPADANRVAAIVGAFDIATRDLNAQIVDWTNRAVE